MNLRRVLLCSSAAVFSLIGCGRDPVEPGDEAADTGTAGDGDGDGDSDTSDSTSGDGDGDPTGDGDGDPTGDGDGDPTGDGDGDPTGDGDGDPTGDGDGDSTGDGDGDPTGDGDGDGDPTGDGDGDPTGDGDGDPTGDGDGDPEPDYAPWILSVDEPDSTTDVLLQISLVDGQVGQTNVICPDIELPPTLPDDTVFTSLTFNSNSLFASVRKQSNGDTLLLIDPCECTSTEIGEYSGYTGVNGITSNELQVMFGASSTQDVILEIDPLNAMSTEINPLPGNWGSTGLTWSDPQDNLLYGINASDDRLYTFDGTDASSIGSIQMNADFGSVGIEYHPGFDVLYACGVSGQATSLFSVDVDSGDVTLEAADVLQMTCDNLAAPFGPVECIPQ